MVHLLWCTFGFKRMHCFLIRSDRDGKDLAAPQGFEPRYPAPEAGVLPLNEGAVVLLSNESKGWSNRPAAWAAIRLAAK